MPSPRKSLLRSLVATCLVLAALLVAVPAAGASNTPGHLDYGVGLPANLGARHKPVAPQLFQAPGPRIQAARHRRHKAKHHRRTHKKHKKKAKRRPAPVVPAQAGPAGPQMALNGWCGQPFSGDDTADAVFPQEPTIKIIYAYPTDRQNSFSSYAPILQADVNVIQHYVARQSSGQKTVRFDMGTSCGPQYVDIQVVKLKHPTSAYLDNYGDPTVDPGTQLHKEIDDATRGEQNHNYIAWVDGLNHIYSGDPMWAWGMTDVLIGDNRPGPDNANNRPGRVAAVFGPDGGLPPQSPTGFGSSMLMHELLHTVGAVQSSAPHATAGGHCWDGGDVMCYNDGTAGGSKFSYNYCNQVGGEIYQPLDCNKDDYFSPNPAPGSYLADHWNVYNSVFLGVCTDARLTDGCNQP